MSISGQAQSLFSLSFAAAHNDKLQKDHHPYIKAFTERLGESFKKEHGPYEERRRVCKWDNKWVECGYLQLSHASSLTQEQKQVITEVMRNPCAYISFEMLKNPPPKRPYATAPFRERKVYGKYENQKWLLSLCQAGSFDATEVRFAEPQRDEKGVIEPDASKDEIGFEARIRVKTKSNSTEKQN